LPEPDLGSGEREIMEPRNDAEHWLFGIWAETIGNKNFGVTNGFIELGGDSLSAMRIVSAMNIEATDRYMLNLLNNGSVISQLELLAHQPRHSAELQGLQDFMQVLSGKDN
ncbi:hypothetical protein AD948_00025, partial [Acetobacter senegalensis]